MGFVEAVTGELLHQVEDRAGGFGIHALGAGAVDEDAALALHLVGLLLAHGPAQQVGVAQRVTGQLLGDLHHLLLVDHDALGLAEQRLQIRVQVLGFLAPVLALYVVGNQVHGPRPVERDQRNDVFQPVRLQLGGQLAHARRFHLEHRRQVSAGKALVGGLIVDGNLQDFQRIFIGRFAGVDHLHRPIDDGQRTQAQEVELHQTHVFQILHVELGDQATTAVLAVQRHEFGERLGGDHHTAGVLAHLPGQALELQRQVDDFLDILFLLIGLLELGNLDQRVFQFGMPGAARFALERGGTGNHLGDAIAETEGMTHHPAHVPNHGARRHGAVGDDLADMVAAILAGHILDDPLAPFHAEVHVEIRHGHAFRVQEALEQQVIGQRVQIGDTDGVGHQRAGA